MKSRFFSFFGCFLIFFACSVSFFTGCMSSRREESFCSRNLLDKGIKNKEQLTSFFMSVSPDSSREQVKHLASLYIEESNIEGINSDCAFVQMCLETGFLKFGNLVKPEMHNYCGLGAIDKDHPGEWFETERLGVRAHVQHLQAYATPAEVTLKQELVDPRYSWVHKTKMAATVFDLAGQWATDKEYGRKLDSLLSKLEQF